MKGRMNSHGKSALSFFGSLIIHNMFDIRVPIPCLLCFLSLVTALAAQSESSTASKTLSPYFFVEAGNEGVECFPLKSTSVVAQNPRSTLTRELCGPWRVLIQRFATRT